jgi:cyclophilin family peptidyl-prolyl cis-trans isomerase
MITKGAVTGYEFSYGYSIFGKVIEGMDVLNSIEDRSFSLDPADTFSDSITSISIIEK